LNHDCPLAVTADTTAVPAMRSCVTQSAFQNQVAQAFRAAPAAVWQA
jgi:hypothetical protein